MTKIPLQTVNQQNRGGVLIVPSLASADWRFPSIHHVSGNEVVPTDTLEGRQPDFVE
jgi:hypothetical protein